jgi:hypothetical protein
MFFNSDHSKEAIKTRMLRIASTYWETKSTDELDPLVKLLMEALSAELYDVMNDIRNAEGRILEKVAQLLAPDLLTVPTPSHAVMQAVPGEASETVTGEDQFYLEKKIASKQDGALDTNVDLYFTATNPTKIFDAQIKYLCCGLNLHLFDQAGSRVLVSSGARGQSVNEYSIWIGLSMNSRLSSINGLSFFFDLKNVDAQIADFFYQFIPLSKWYVGGREIPVAPGLPEAEITADTATEDSITNTDIMNSIRKNINNYYKKKFVTIIDEGYEANLKTYPNEFNDAFPQTVLQKLTEPATWIRIVFPGNIQQELLNEILVRTNAFPVMNCKRNELRYRLRNGRNIIPIPNVENERFLAIKSFTDGETNYKAIPFKKSADEETGTYTLRTGGLERFDSRNSREMIQYLIELLRSESAAFSAYGHDFIAGTLKELNQFIALLEQKTNTTITDATEIPNYIVTKPRKNKELMFAEYWTTNMHIANNIRSGTKLQQMGGVSVKQESLMLLTSTMGGKDKLKPEEKLVAFKYGLLTRDRIVTAEDIRSFCFYELGNKLKQVTVKRGYEISDNPKEGAKRTIDVTLIPSPLRQGQKEEWLLLCDQLKAKLQNKSGMSYNYRVISETDI